MISANQRFLRVFHLFIYKLYIKFDKWPFGRFQHGCLLFSQAPFSCGISPLPPVDPSAFTRNAPEEMDVLRLILWALQEGRGDYLSAKSMNS